jgi:hypothetical protein
MKLDLDIYGIYFPSVTLNIIYGLLLFLALRYMLNKFRAYDYVWHRSLFNLSLLILLIWLVKRVADPVK